MAVGTVAACCTTRIYVATLCSCFFHIVISGKNLATYSWCYTGDSMVPRNVGGHLPDYVRDDLTHEGKVSPVHAVKTRSRSGRFDPGKELGGLRSRYERF